MTPILSTPSQLSFGAEFDSSPTHRLFLAIRPDAEADDRLTQLMATLRENRIAVGMPVDADRRHITVIHLGTFVDQLPPRLIATVRTAAAMVVTRPFDVTFDYVVGNATGLRLLASDISPSFKDFMRILSAALIMAGLSWRNVSPTSSPHVSLSYGGEAVPRKPVEQMTWRVDEFVLIESLIGKHRHLERGRWSLRP